VTLRAFRTAATARGQVIVYDPCSGTTRLAPHSLPAGRCLLDDAQARGWPLAHPASLGLDVPVSVCWSPLVRCNLSCPHCLDDTSVPELDAARRASASRLIGASGILGVDISGGEPLLLRDLPELAAGLAAGGCAVSVTTNGWHLARRARQLAGHLDAVRVSLDAPGPSRHDALRGTGSFSRALDGIRACTHAGIPVQIQTVLMASAARHAQAIIDLAARAGANGVTFLQMLPLGKGTAMAAAEMVGDQAAASIVHSLEVPFGLTVRLRERGAAEGFTVVRADGRIWRNGTGALTITATRPLTHPRDLALNTPDGSA
jgi:sulfatase maturation enzyme AslB (radical SAM superfamily)